VRKEFTIIGTGIYVTWHGNSKLLEYVYTVGCGPGSSVVTATGYGLDGPGIESRLGRDFPPVQIGPEAHPASCTVGTESFPGVKSGRGVRLTPHPLLVPWSRKSRAIPLLPLWTVRPVQSLSACTRVHFTFYLTHRGLYMKDVGSCMQFTAMYPQCTSLILLHDFKNLSVLTGPPRVGSGTGWKIFLGSLSKSFTVNRRDWLSVANVTWARSERGLIGK